MAVTMGPIIETVARENNMDLKLEGKVALITGASRGLGAACARLLAAEGARLTLTARDANTLEAPAEEIRASTGADVATVAQDLTEPGGADRVATAALDAYGVIDILVKSAGALGKPGYGILWVPRVRVYPLGIAMRSAPIHGVK